MKALSIQQPWAWLIAHDHKPVENRTWPTKFRGRILIHAGKKIDKEGLQWVKDNFHDIKLPEKFDTGGIVGEAVISDCVDFHTSDWFFGPFGFVMEDAKPIPFIPCRGQLGFFKPELNSEEGACTTKQQKM